MARTMILSEMAARFPVSAHTMIRQHNRGGIQWMRNHLIRSSLDGGSGWSPGASGIFARVDSSGILVYPFHEWELTALEKLSSRTIREVAGGIRLQPLSLFQQYAGTKCAGLLVRFTVPSFLLEIFSGRHIPLRFWVSTQLGAYCLNRKLKNVK